VRLSFSSERDWRHASSIIVAHFGQGGLFTDMMHSRSGASITNSLSPNTAEDGAVIPHLSSHFRHCRFGPGPNFKIK
jgi:hypothetical protein